MFGKKKDRITKKVSYWIHSANGFDEYTEKKLALELFDVLAFKDNIFVDVWNAYADREEIIKKFTKKVECKIINDTKNKHRFSIFIPKLQSNLDLYYLISSMDIQTEWNYIPDLKDVESFLYSFGSSTWKNMVEHNVSKFQALFGADFDLYFRFDTRQYKVEDIEQILTKWEKTFQSAKFEKRMNTRGQHKGTPTRNKWGTNGDGGM